MPEATSNDAPRPIATGQLATTPITHLLVYVLDRKLTGTLVLEVPDFSKSAIFFLKGVPCKMRPAETVHRFGEILVERGAVAAPMVDEALRTGEGLLGERLVAQGLIDATAVERWLVEQLMRRLVWSMHLPVDTVYGFYTDHDFLAPLPRPPVLPDPLSAIWRCVETLPAPDVHGFIGRLGSRELRLHLRAKPQRFQFPSKGTAALDVLRARPQSFAALSEAGLVDPGTLARMIVALGITRHLDLGREGQDPVGVEPGMSKSPPPHPSVRPRMRTDSGLGPAPNSRPPSDPGAVGRAAVLRQELKELLGRFEHQNYYDLLGVAEDAPASGIQAAFFALAKKWHPDKLPLELGDLRPDITRVFARISEAHQVLSSEVTRAEYDRLRSESGANDAEQEKIERVLRAATAMHKAEICLKRNDLAGAERHAQEAYEDDPEQPEYAAFYAWVTAQVPRKDREYERLIRILDDALHRDKGNVRIHFYRGSVLKRAGRDQEALREFRFVAEVDPGNLEAVREVRLSRMRAEGKEDSKADSGILGKLFKK